MHALPSISIEMLGLLSGHQDNFILLKARLVGEFSQLGNLRIAQTGCEGMQAQGFA